MTDYILDRNFERLASDKGKIVNGIKNACPEGWVWLIIEEYPTRIILEIRDMRGIDG